MTSSGFGFQYFTHAPLVLDAACYLYSRRARATQKKLTSKKLSFVERNGWFVGF